MKGNFQARFWSSDGRGDSPTDCRTLSERAYVRSDINMYPDHTPVSPESYENPTFFGRALDPELDPRSIVLAL